MTSTIEQNKKTVVRFNKEFIEKGNVALFKELVAEDVFNHAASPGSSSGPDGMFYFLQNILKAAFPDLKVDILDQIGEDDKVTTRKTFYGTHTGELMGIPASHKKVTIYVIEIVRLKNGKYVEHWGMSNLADVIAEISA
jgi:steroid delta-isomerase-like uncharacterized protein